MCLATLLAAYSHIEAAPVKFNQVQQVLNARPNQGLTSNFARLQVSDYYSGILVTDGDDDDKDKDKKKGQTGQDGRVITETRTDIVSDEDCHCEMVEVHRAFPKWALLGLAAIPVAFILIHRKKDTPTPTGTLPPPTSTPTPTPTLTPTPTETPFTPTPTPPQPVPEPITILLFGTGLASVGLAARRKFGKRRDDNSGNGDI